MDVDCLNCDCYIYGLVCNCSHKMSVVKYLVNGNWKTSNLRHKSISHFIKYCESNNVDWIKFDDIKLVD